MSHIGASVCLTVTYISLVGTSTLHMNQLMKSSLNDILRSNLIPSRWGRKEEKVASSQCE